MKTKFFALLAAVLFAGAFSLTAKTHSLSDAVRLRLDLDRPVIFADTTEKVVLKVVLDGLRLPSATQRPPVNLCLVLDRSGSMSGDKITRAKDAAIEAVRRLGPDDVFSLVAYNNGVETLVPATRAREIETIESRIREIHPDGGTNLFGGVSQGAAEIRRHLEGCYTHRVILLSDGLANVGPSSPEDLARLGVALVKEGISVTTVGVGTDYNEDLMTRLARRSDGNTYFVESSRDLPRIFNEELGDVLAVVARRVVVELEFPEGVRPIAFVGRDGIVNGHSASFSLNQLYGGQEKFALIEVEVAPGASGATRELAMARVRYHHAMAQDERMSTARSNVRFDRRRKTVVDAANARVQTDYAVNVLAAAKDRAVELVDANRKAEAAAELKKQVASLDELATTYKNSAVSSLNARERTEAARLEREGLSNVQRKNYRTDSSQIFNQQRSN